MLRLLSSALATNKKTILILIISYKKWLCMYESSGVHSKSELGDIIKLMWVQSCAGY